MEEAAKGVKLLGLVEQSSLGDDTPPSPGSAGGLGLNARGPNMGCTGIFAESDRVEHRRLAPSGPWGELNTDIGGKVTGRPDCDVT